MASIAVEFEWDEELSKERIVELLEACQQEIDRVWESASVQVRIREGLESVLHEIPVQKWAQKLDPEKTPMFNEEKDYREIGCSLWYSPLTDTPVSVDAWRDRGTFHLRFELNTIWVLDEGVPIDHHGNFCENQQVDIEEIDDLRDYFYPAWLTNGEVLKRIAEVVQVQCTPSNVQVSPEIANPEEKADLDRGNLLDVKKKNARRL